jgi:hypothetical protein
MSARNIHASASTLALGAETAASGARARLDTVMLDVAEALLSGV